MTVRRNNYLRHPHNRDIGSAVYAHFASWREGAKKLWINTKTAVHPFVKLLIQLLYWRLSLSRVMGLYSNVWYGHGIIGLAFRK